MSKYNKLAHKPEAWDFTQAWLRKKSPIIYLYGPSGVGKTHSFKQLLEHQLTDGRRPYAPVLYIDGDNGNETIGAAAENAKLCKLWDYDGMYDGMLSWFFEKLEKAEDVDCGAIIIEGFNALFQSMLTPAMRELSKIAGTAAWQAHNDPSQRMDTIFQAVKQLKVNRRYKGKGVPIFVTLNTRQVDRVTGEPQSGKMDIPNFSRNRIDSAMGTADAFIELVRGAQQRKMLVTPDTCNQYRKLRRSVVARKVEASFDLSLPGLLALWAFELERDRNRLNEEMQQVLDSVQADSEDPQDSNG